MKNKAKQDIQESSPAKKAKPNEKPLKKASESSKTQSKGPLKKPLQKGQKKPLKPPYDKLKSKKSPITKQSTTEKTDWQKFKQEKKKLRLERRSKKPLIEVIQKAKKIGEKLRMKTLEGGNQAKCQLVRDLHALMGDQDNYVKFVLTHDMARIVQYMLKFGPEEIRKTISDQLAPSSVIMLQSNYGKFVVKAMLKYGNSEIRAKTLKACYGHAVNLCSHAVSAPIFEFAYNMYASPADKQALIQEFFGDMYKQLKDSEIKHLRDVYKDNENMKTAALSATKANFTRILNKELLDSTLVHSVLWQFLSECLPEDKSDLISQLATHIVVLSNSKDGSRVAMEIIWHGTNKDKKAAIKALKTHAVDLCKHEHGHCTIIAALDSVDDTVLLNKALVGEIIAQIDDLMDDEWGRKVLTWLVNPADRKHFHPHFISVLEEGRKVSTAKKDCQLRRSEIYAACGKNLLEKITEDVEKWFRNAKTALVALEIIKSAFENKVEGIAEVLDAVCKFITDPQWNEGDNCKIEDAGIHMVLKKLAQNDNESLEFTFGEALMKHLNAEIVENWSTKNRGCFLLADVYQNGKKEVQQQLQAFLKPLKSQIKKQTFAGANILIGGDYCNHGVVIVFCGGQSQQDESLNYTEV